MINKLRSKMKRIFRPAQTFATDQRPLSRNAYREPGNQWYLPALAGPASFMPRTIGAAIVRDVLIVMNELTPDVYLDFSRNFYRAGLERFGEHWYYADINTVLLGLSRALQPENYLEIGVRRGRSMAMVASQAPMCRMYGFDLWIKDYAGMENPGEGLVHAELKRVGHQAQAQFIAGDSRATVPAFFQEHKDLYFDLITVDGDHSVEGARSDLLAVMPRLKAGGVLVFDDTSNQSHPGLADVWSATVVSHPDFAAYTFNEVGFGVGFAVRKV
jgi:predicted O-methyltransferase YrrM